MMHSNYVEVFLIDLQFTNECRYASDPKQDPLTVV